jgi:hypothetical protein
MDYECTPWFETGHNQCVIPYCTNGSADNWLETDVDCGGGYCNGCATGGVCFSDADCASTSCVGGLCE